MNNKFMEIIFLLLIVVFIAYMANKNKTRVKQEESTLFQKLKSAADKNPQMTLKEFLGSLKEKNSNEITIPTLEKQEVHTTEKRQVSHPATS